MKNRRLQYYSPHYRKEVDFKDFVMHNHTKVDNIEQLISLSNMGRSCFFTKFNEVFGMTAKQWMLKQKNQRILEKNDGTRSMYKRYH